MRKALAALLFVFLTASLAVADTVATYSYEDGTTIKISIRDSDHVRMDTSEKSYMLVKGEKIYSVSRDDDGKWMVMDMDQMKGMASGGLSSMFGAGNSASKTYKAEYEKTGRKENVAGYTGEVYNVRVYEDGREISSDEVVLSSHSDLKKVNEAWVSISEKMSSMMGQSMSKAIEEASAEAKNAGYGGMLRYGDQMRLQSLEKQSFDALYYDFPSNAQQVQMGGAPSMGQPDDSYPEEEDYEDTDSGSDEEESSPSVEDIKQGAQKLFKGLFD